MHTKTIMFLILAATAVAQERGGDRPFGAPFAGRSEVFARNGMAATSQPLASLVAIDILRRGGSAVDAAIAANATLALMEPTGCGIGGDLFAIVWDPKSRQLHGLNASGRSPMGMDRDALEKKIGHGRPIPAFGALAVSVPGTVSGWLALHGRFGRLKLTEVLDPAMGYALQGFPVSEIIAGYWAMNVRRLNESQKAVGDLSEFERVFLVDGRAPKKGEIFANPRLAATLETIGEKGRDGFYSGSVAAAIVAACRAGGSAMTLKDLLDHRAEWVTPVSTTYRGHEIFELPPNGQGIAALQMLNILEGFDLAEMGHNSPGYLHAQVEAKKLAFADRARFYADPAFSNVPVTALVGKKYAARRRALIGSRAAASVDAGHPGLDDGDTIYLTVADRDGMMVSLIQSNYMGMGSGIVPKDTGFMLQNRGCLFTMQPGHPNVFAPGKRPFHTIIPAFALKDGKPWLSFGVMGGAMQPQGHVQILCNLIDFGMSLQAAGDAPRYNHTGSSQPTGTSMSDGGVVHLESGIPLQTRAALEKLGHRTATRGSYGGYQAIMRDPSGVYRGATEMRKDGTVIGY